VRWSSRVRDRTLNAQRAMLEHLRADLATLVADAEERARAHEETLGAREERLKALLADIARVEATPRPERRSRAASNTGVGAIVRESAGLARRLAPEPTEGAPPRSPGADAPKARPLMMDADTHKARPPVTTDPAEARLLRDLELRLPRAE
jgi:hypothetical protein